MAIYLLNHFERTKKIAKKTKQSKTKVKQKQNKSKPKAKPKPKQSKTKQNKLRLKRNRSKKWQNKRQNTFSRYVAMKIISSCCWKSNAQNFYLKIYLNLF